MQINRLFETVYILLSKKNVTAGYLAENLGVCVRTVYRDIDALSLAGIPVYAEKGKGGGVRLMPEYVMNKTVLSDGEQEEVLTALQGLQSMKAINADQAISKLSAIFKKDARDWLNIDFSDWGNKYGEEFEDLKTAVLKRRIIEFDYYGTSGEKTRRRAEPYQICFKSNAWYLKGYCLEKQDLRFFKLTRIKNLALTSENFSKRSLELSGIYINAEKEKPQIDLLLKISSSAAFRIYDEFDADNIEKQEDGSFLIRFNCPENDWVYSFILSYGDDMEVLKPDYVREIIKEKAENILKKYF